MIKKLFIALALIGIFLGAACVVAYQSYQSFLSSSVFTAEDTILVIEKGDSYQDFVTNIQKLGADGESWHWKVLGRLKKGHQYIKAGEFEISQNVTPMELLELLKNNKVITYQLTIVEGTQWKELKNQLLNHQVLVSKIGEMSDAEIMTYLSIQAPNLEGQFLPETYQFIKGDTDLSILTRAHAALNDILDSAWQNRSPELVLSNPYELLILASIVEKESAVENEHPIISGVFNRRLKKNMRLQTDPTVIYGIGESYAGDITRKHLQTDTPYNTYTRAGLPPTPIAFSGAAAINASAQPNNGNELYFVADGKGGHVFSANYAAHQKAVQNYLKISRNKQRGE